MSRFATALAVTMLCLHLIFSPLQLSAQTTATKGISITPPLKEVVLGPGLLEASAPVGLANNTEHDVEAQLRLVDFESLSETGGVSLGQVGAPPTKYSLAKWMSLPGGTTITIPKGKSIQVPVTISNTSDLAPGGHYGALIASIRTTGTNGGNNEVNLKQELVSLLFVKKLGGETYGLEFRSLEPNSTKSVPDTVTIRFKSTGNVHVVPRGYIEVTDPRGRVVAKGIINSESSMILPDKTHKFVTIMQPVASAKNWGTYTITAYYRYDGKEEFSKHSVQYGRSVPLIYAGGIVMLVGVASGAAVIMVRQKLGKQKRTLRSGK